MNKNKLSKLLSYIILIQIISILFALLIERIIDLLVQLLEISLGPQILLLLLIVVLGLLIFWIIYRKILRILLFEPISESILSEKQKNDFLILLKKVKNKDTLSKYQKSKLEYFVRRSPLPSDFVAKQTSNLKLSPCDV